MLSINTNSSKIQLGNNLNKAVDSYNTAIERLSTGYKINKAADDAAGLSISENLQTQTRGLTQAQKNTQDAKSFLSIAEGGLTSIKQSLQRIRELALQSANGTYTDNERASMQKEVSQLRHTMYQTIDGLNFNGQKVIDDGSNGVARLEESLFKKEINQESEEEIMQKLNDGTYKSIYALETHPIGSVGTFVISSKDELKELARVTSLDGDRTRGKTFILAKDIDLENEEWETIGLLIDTGTTDADGRVIYV